METSGAAARTSCCTYEWLTIVEWAGPGLNSRPGLYLLKDTISLRPLNGTGFYSEETSIRGNTVYIICIYTYRVIAVVYVQRTNFIHKLSSHINNVHTYVYTYIRVHIHKHSGNIMYSTWELLDLHKSKQGDRTNQNSFSMENEKRAAQVRFEPMTYCLGGRYSTN